MLISFLSQQIENPEINRLPQLYRHVLAWRQLQEMAFRHHSALKSIITIILEKRNNHSCSLS